MQQMSTGVSQNQRQYDPQGIAAAGSASVHNFRLRPFPEKSFLLVEHLFPQKQNTIVLFSVLLHLSMPI
jgi:hypothetical protein